MNLNDLVDEIYVINLDERLDRLESVTNQFKQMNSEFTRCSAVKSQHRHDGPKQSFLNVINDAIDKGQTCIAVCEDDVVFRRQLLEDLPFLFSQIKETDFDVLCFHHYCGIEKPIENRDIGEDKPLKLIPVKRKPFCVHFMILKNLPLWRDSIIESKTHSDTNIDRTLTVGVKSKAYITSKEYTFQLDDFSDVYKNRIIRFRQKNKYKDIIK